ncbi:Branched-chain amino acid aminotransferase/4-amino-4-deoxychorismate lyase [Saccharopolyspora antimicrobica]|uniref:Branched-chain amino acid aminotransferase/4-amino-4-deoxychorismate lyase n=1 Tax=Saccharopolyspora antimicrobica TaxID=455193 RepID=A0A1I5HFT5_9PSEU|nr:aminotransferase class IV family protein [Saccharopolyspora antimicrobica]RKT85330.1 branched-subunit amino acid aminotransferase/4-amino-4-deoxychorismate lyase [Saccharopolyspora antimicrobica]SFO46836.1 Branched-chain amino acid aminotransferase/4-amino-4-deoxychorismate lyase [Saccharopolyspora antimicrobica]
MSFFAVQRNGREATAEELAPLAFAGFAHMTAMQVRDGGVRGLDLHLERLRNASLTMFGQALPDDQVRAHLRTAVEGSPADHSLLATVYSNAGEFTAADGPLEVLVRTSPAASGPTGPLSLMTVEHERALPELKHVGEVSKTHSLRRAVAQGFDDAVFLDRRGRFSEASIWNLAFWDGEAVVWPDADMLVGTMMGTVRRQLEGFGVPQRTAQIRPADLPELAGAVVMNSWTPGIAVHRIDATDVPAAPEFLELLHRAHQAEPLVAP